MEVYFLWHISCSGQDWKLVFFFPQFFSFRFLFQCFIISSDVFESFWGDASFLGTFFCPLFWSDWSRIRSRWRTIIHTSRFQEVFVTAPVFFSCFLRNVIQLSKVYLHLRSLMRSLTSHQLPMLEDRGRGWSALTWLSRSLAVPVEANWTTRSFVNDGWSSCCWTGMISDVLNARNICSWAGEKEGGTCRNIQMLICWS